MGDILYYGSAILAGFFTAVGIWVTIRRIEDKA